MDIYIINALDRANFFGFESASRLNFIAILVVTLLVHFIITVSIYLELRKIDILTLIRE